MFNLSIVTPEKLFYEGETNSLIAPGELGYLGVLTDHAPLITSLIPGKLIIKDVEEKEIIFAVSGGFLEVLKNKATILTDSIELAQNIDMERAKNAMERARQRLKSKEKYIDIPRALAALKRAENRIYIYEKHILEQ
jgi:F-type H+-transporting ATPase subunit epsilon